MTTPYWVQDAVFYQIFPDRFANGDPTNDPANVAPWGSPPHIYKFQGGDLRGIIQHFDYLLDLGINAIYLNPIFQSTSTHRYNISDYYKIDPKLGGMHDFQALLEIAHRNNMHIILDGVFNHCGRGFFAFQDVLENNEFSPYQDWFYIYRFPLDAYGDGQARNYAAWWGFKSLPKLNMRNPAVRRYILDVARYWIEQGADGWRLDVPNEIDDDEFWAQFRYEIKAIAADAYLVGEIWTADPRWANDRHFDGLMNYPLREALLACLTGHSNIVQFANTVENLLTIYPRENAYAMYLPLGSHDTERLKIVLGGSMAKVKLAFLFQMAYPGAPAIYYGDEIGLEGGKDPDCRRAFPWNDLAWDTELRHWVKTLIALRRRTPALRRGDYERLLVDERGLYVFRRQLGQEKIIVALNASPSTQRLELDAEKAGWHEGYEVKNLIDYRKYGVSEGYLTLTLSPWSGVWLT